MGEGGEPDRLMDIVLRETERLNTLIEDFLTYARPRPPVFTAVDLAPLLFEVAKMVEASRFQGVQVVCECASDLTVIADADQLRQLIWNLCVNGVQAMPDGGQLALSAKRVGPESQGSQSRRRNELRGEPRSAPERGVGRVQIAVRDTGCGIPQEIRERMFEPFFTSKRRGSGLGLATVHRIVESHGATLQIESSVGVGSTFTIGLASADSQRESQLERGVNCA
jgi:two-component system sensor histidine kinase PilS (NtrC family)